MTQQSTAERRRQSVEKQRELETESRQRGIPEIRRLLAEKDYFAAFTSGC